MPKKTNSGNDLVNGPGNAGAYGLVKVGGCAEHIDWGLFVEKPGVGWVKNDELVDLAMEVDMVIMEGVERVGSEHWLFKICAIPRDLLRGFEEYVREWVDELPGKAYTVEVGSRMVWVRRGDGSLELRFVDEDGKGK